MILLRVLDAVDPVQQVLSPLALFHAYLLGFATVIVVLVAVAQRRHWRWLVPIAPVVALRAYGPIAAVFLVSALARSQVGGAGTSYQTILMLELASILSFPTLIALIGLSHTVRGCPRAADPDLEVTSIGSRTGWGSRHRTQLA